ITILNNIISCNCLDNSIHCDCICKHSCFILIEFLKFNIDELNDIFINHKFNDETYVKILEKTDIMMTCLNESRFTNIENFSVDKKQKKDKMCIICYNDFNENCNIIQCPDCKNVIHKLCMEFWLKK